MYAFQQTILSCICIGSIIISIGCDSQSLDDPTIYKSTSSDFCGDGTPISGSTSKRVRVKSNSKVYPGALRFVLKQLISLQTWTGVNNRCFNAHGNPWANTINVNWCRGFDSEIFHLERRSTDGEWRLRANRDAISSFSWNKNKCVTRQENNLFADTLHFTNCNDNDSNQIVELRAASLGGYYMTFGGKYARLAYPQPSIGFSPIRNHVVLDSRVVTKHDLDDLYAWKLEEQSGTNSNLADSSRVSFSANDEWGDADGDACPDEVDSTSHHDSTPGQCGQCAQSSCENGGMCLQLVDGRQACVYHSEQCPSGASSISIPGIEDSSFCYTAKLTPGPVDIDGDGIADLEFVSFGPDSGFLDSLGPYGLVGNIGGGPGSGAAWVRDTSTVVAGDGVGRNEIIAPFRGALPGSDNNWSKVHFSSGEGWVQWALGDLRSVVWPVRFVRENPGEDLSASQAAARRE